MYYLDKLHVKVISRRNFWFTISGIMFVIGLVAIMVRGLNFGIDFTGGTIVQRTFERPASVAQVREALTKAPLAELGLEGSSLQGGAGNTIIIRTRALSPADEKALDAGLTQLVGPMKVDGSSTDTVGPIMGKELYAKAMAAMVIASLLMLVYIAFRFEFKFGAAAVLALLHDGVITTGIIALVGQEVNTPFVAAILTILGYSINDTIVIFDRIRENLRVKRQLKSVDDVVEFSVNQTLSRSINTVLTVIFATIALFVFAGSALREFSLTLLVGISLGCYSSIFVASPLWTLFKSWEKKKGRTAPAKA